MRIYSATYYADNKERKLQQQRVRIASIPGLAAARQNIKRALAAGWRYPNGITFTSLSLEIAPVYAEAQRQSKVAGVWHVVDHKIPLLAGGSPTLENLEIITNSENIRKGRRADKAAIAAYRLAKEIPDGECVE